MPTLKKDHQVEIINEIIVKSRDDPSFEQDYKLATHTLKPHNARCKFPINQNESSDTFPNDQNEASGLMHHLSLPMIKNYEIDGMNLIETERR